MKRTRFFLRCFAALCGGLSITLLPVLGGCAPARAGADSPLFGLETAPTEAELSPESRRTYAMLAYSAALAREDEAGVRASAPLLRAAEVPAQIWLEGAVWLMGRGTDAVLPFVEEGVAAWPDNMSLILLQAEALAANGMGARACEIMSAYLEKHPDAVDARLELALLLVKASRYQEAEKLFNDIPAGERTAIVEYYHGRALAGMDRAEEAIPHLRRAIKENPSFVEAMLELAFVHERRSELEKARALYVRLLNRPDISQERIALRLVTISLRMGQPERALGYVKRGPDTDSFRLAAAGLLMEHRHPLQAETLLRQVAESGDAPADVFLLLASLSYEQRRNLAQACAWLDRLPADGPDGMRALLLRIQLHGQARKWEEAMKLARQGREEFPDAPDFAVMEVHLLMSQKRREDAHRAAEDLARWPDDEDAAFLRASLMDERGRKKEAMEIMEGIIRSHPDSYQALNYVGYTLAEQDRDLDRALELLRRANELSPNQSYIVDSLAWALFKKGDLDAALAEIRRAVEIDGDADAAIWEHYGDIASRAGRTDEARKAYNRALEKKPDNADAIRAKLR